MMSSLNDKKQRRLTSLLALIKIRIEDFSLSPTAIKEKLHLTSSNEQITTVTFYNFIENQLKIPLTTSDKEILESEYLIDKEHIDSKSFLSDINMYTDNLSTNVDYKHILEPTNEVNHFDQTEKSTPNLSEIQYDIELDQLKAKYNPESTSTPELPTSTHNDHNYDPLNDSDWNQEKDNNTNNAHIDSFTSFLNKLKLDSETSFDIDPSYYHHPTESTNTILAAAAAASGDDDIGQSILQSWKKLSTLADNTTVPTLPTTVVPYTNTVTAPYTSPYSTTHPPTAPTTLNPHPTTAPTHNNIEPEIVLSKSEHKLYTELLKHSHPIHIGKEIINKIHQLSSKKQRNNTNNNNTYNSLHSLYYLPTHTDNNTKGQNYDHEEDVRTDGYISCSDLSDILVSTGLHLSHIDIELLSAGFSSDGKYSNIKGSELCQVIEEILYKIIHSNKIQNMLYNSSNSNNKDNSCIYLLSNQENIAWMFTPMNIYDLPVRYESYGLASYDDVSDYRRIVGDFEDGADGVRSGVEARLDPPSTLLVLIQLCHVFTRSLCSPTTDSEAPPDVPPDLKRLLHLAITPPTNPHTPTSSTTNSTNTYNNNTNNYTNSKYTTTNINNKSMKEYLKSKETYLTYLQKLAVKPFLIYDNNKTGSMNISQFIVAFSDVFPDVPLNILHALIAVYTSSTNTSMSSQGDRGHNIDLTRSLPGPLSSTVYGTNVPVSRSINMTSQEYSSDALLYASSAFPGTSLLDRSYRSDREGEGDYASPYRTNSNNNTNNNMYHSPHPITTPLTPPRSTLAPPPKINTTHAPPHTSTAPIKYKKFLREFLKVYEHFLYSDYCIHLASALDPTTNPTNNNNIHSNTNNTNSNKSIWFIKVFDVIHSLLVQLECMSYRKCRQLLVQLHHKLIPYITSSSTTTATTTTTTNNNYNNNNNNNNTLDGFQFIEILTEVGLIMTKDQRMQLLRVFESPTGTTSSGVGVGLASTVNYLQLSQVCISILLLFVYIICVI